MIRVKEIIKRDQINFFDLLKKEFNDNNISHDYFGMKMVIKKEFVGMLINVALEIMDKYLGIKIKEINVKSFNDSNDEDISFGVKMYLLSHRFSGYDVPGFYKPDKNTIYIKCGIHLETLIPTLFHELTHAYMHQEYIDMTDDYEKPKTTSFAFKDLMYEANQNEGFCEMISTIMCYLVFNIEQYPSDVIEYWLGWRLCIEAFFYFYTQIEKINNNYASNSINKLSIQSIINLIRINNNLYKFVQMVPSDSYHRKIN